MANFKVKSWSKERRAGARNGDGVAFFNLGALAHFDRRGEGVNGVVVVTVVNDHSAAVAGNLIGQHDFPAEHRDDRERNRRVIEISLMHKFKTELRVNKSSIL